MKDMFEYSQYEESNNQDEKKTEQKKQEKKDNKRRDFIYNYGVNETTSKDAMAFIIDVNRHDEEAERENPDYVRKPINLIVGTYGGSVYDGLALISVMNSSKTPVYTYLPGKAMSMGFAIFTGGHKRFISPLATLMYHEISSVLQGKKTEIEESVKQMDNLQKIYDKYITTHSKITQEQLDEAKKCKDDWYLTADEAIKYGLADAYMESTVMTYRSENGIG